MLVLPQCCKQITRACMSVASAQRVCIPNHNLQPCVPRLLPIPNHASRARPAGCDDLSPRGPRLPLPEVEMLLLHAVVTGLVTGPCRGSASSPATGQSRRQLLSSGALTFRFLSPLRRGHPAHRRRHPDPTATLLPRSTRQACPPAASQSAPSPRGLRVAAARTTCLMSHPTSKPSVTSTTSSMRRQSARFPLRSARPWTARHR